MKKQYSLSHLWTMLHKHAACGPQKQVSRASPFSHLISPPFSSLLLSSYPRSSASFHSAEQIPQRRIHYFTSGTELSHCEQHIAGINAHQLAKLCAFSKWVAGFRGTRASRRPLRDCSPVKLAALAPAVLRMLRFAFVFRSVLPV